MNTLTLLLADVNETFWFPPKASTFVEETDSLFMAIMWISVFFFVLVVGGMIYFVLKFRRRPGYRGDSSALHNNALEITWTVIPTLIVIWIFAEGVDGYVKMVTPPPDTIDINVVARKWDWQFEYPNGAISDQLHIPNNRAIRLRMRSVDVLHAFYVPAFRAKADVVPGRVTTMWFQPTKEGAYDLFCAEYCGDQHSEMIKDDGVVVHSQEEYEKWLEEAAKPPTHPVYYGYWLYSRRGCKSCHSLEEGKKIVGPWFAGSYGNDVPLATGGTVKFDDNYVQESILEPQAKARAGYESASQMPSYQGQLNLEELMALTAFLKAMSDQPDFVALAADDDGFTEADAITMGWVSDEDDPPADSSEETADDAAAPADAEGSEGEGDAEKASTATEDTDES